MRRPSSIILVVVSVWAAVLPTAGQPGGQVGEASAIDDVAPTLELRDKLDESLGDRSLFPSLREFRSASLSWLDEEAGLKVTANYDLLGQATLGLGGDLGASAGDLSVSGLWRLPLDSRDEPLQLSFRFRHRHALSSLPPSDLRERSGLLWGTTDGFTDAGFQVPDFFLTETFLDRKLGIRFGQMTIDSLLDDHRLRSAKRLFLNQAFSANPAVAFPSFGAGATVWWRSPSGWDVTVAASNVQGTRQTDQVDWNLSSSALFEAAQVGWTFDGLNDERARIQLLGWHSDAIPEEDLPEGEGVSLTVEQDGLPERSRLFVRAAWSSGEATRASRFGAVGWGREMRKFDFLGFGVGAGQASQGGGWQGSVEGFYRWQASPELTVTPDLQVVFGESLRGDSDLPILVFGLRGGWSY